ncbi:MAG: Crp/Fnr family transcriptional regulator [Filifactoraceae bacterium]
MLDKNVYNKNVQEFYEVYPLLKLIDERSNLVIRKNINYRELEAGELLMTYGGGCLGFLFVISGKIKIKKLNEDGDETFLYDIGKGEFCHEAINCHMNNISMNVTGVAEQVSKIAIIPFEIVNKYLLADSSFMEYCYKDLYRKFTQITIFKEESIHEDIEKRIVKWLLSRNTKNIYITHSELAFELGTAREVVSRKLKSLENEGYIETRRGKIALKESLNSYL